MAPSSARDGPKAAYLLGERREAARPSASVRAGRSGADGAVQETNDS